MNKPTIVLSLAAGLLGGMLSRYLTPMPVLPRPHRRPQPPQRERKP